MMRRGFPAGVVPGPTYFLSFMFVDHLEAGLGDNIQKLGGGQ